MSSQNGRVEIWEGVWKEEEGRPSVPGCGLQQGEMDAAVITSNFASGAARLLYKCASDVLPLPFLEEAFNLAVQTTVLRVRTQSAPVVVTASGKEGGEELKQILQR